MLVEQYIINLNIEAETAASIARTMILPAAIRHLNELQAAPTSTVLVDETDDAGRRARRGDLRARGGQRRRTPRTSTSLGEAKYMRDTVIPAMVAVREIADQLEKIVADDLWPLPKYEEMLFIK